MNKLNINNEEFEEVTWQFEKEFEDNLLSKSFDGFNNYFVIPFKYTLYPDFIRMYSVEADIALVSKDYSHWYICEVELSTHSFESHIIPQIKKLFYSSISSNFLKDIKLNKKLYDLLNKKYKGIINQKRLKTLIANNTPEILLVFDNFSILEKKNKPYFEILSEYCKIIEIKFFKNSNEEYGFIVKGDNLANVECNAKYNTKLWIDRPSLFQINLEDKLAITVESKNKNKNLNGFELSWKVHPNNLRIITIEDDIFNGIAKGEYFLRYVDKKFYLIDK